MSKEALSKVVQRAISDASFRRQLNSDPAGALRGFDLTADEVSAVRTGDAGRLSTLGIDQRMSKAFLLGGGLAATRMAATDLSGSSQPLVDDVSSGGSRSLVDDVSSGGSRSLVDDVSGAGSRSIIPNDADATSAGDPADTSGATQSVRTGDDWKFETSGATQSVRTGDDWKFETGADVAQQSTGMAAYPAHDGLAGPSGVESVRSGDDWARANADAGGAATGDGTSFVDESEAYLTRVHDDDSNVANSPATESTWSGDDIAGPASVEDAADSGRVGDDGHIAE